MENNSKIPINSKLFQHILLVASPVLIVPLSIFGLENSIDYLYNRYITKNWIETRGKILGASIVKLTPKNVEIILSKKNEKRREACFFVPKIKFEYVVNGKLYQSSHANYKRKKFRDYEKSKEFLIKQVERFKKNNDGGGSEGNNEILVKYSPKKHESGRILDPRHGGLLGYSFDEGRKKIILNAGGLLGVGGVLGYSYMTASDVIRGIARKYLGYTLVLNVILIGFVMQKRFREDVIGRYGRLKVEEDSL